MTNQNSIILGKHLDDTLTLDEESKKIKVNPDNFITEFTLEEGNLKLVKGDGTELVVPIKNQLQDKSVESVRLDGTDLVLVLNDSTEVTADLSSLGISREDTSTLRFEGDSLEVKVSNHENNFFKPQTLDDGLFYGGEHSVYVLDAFNELKNVAIQLVYNEQGEPEIRLVGVGIWITTVRNSPSFLGLASLEDDYLYDETGIDSRDIRYTTKDEYASKPYKQVITTNTLFTSDMNSFNIEDTLSDMTKIPLQEENSNGGVLTLVSNNSEETADFGYTAGINGTNPLHDYGFAKRNFNYDCVKLIPEWLNPGINPLVGDSFYRDNSNLYDYVTLSVDPVEEFSVETIPPENEYSSNTYNLVLNSSSLKNKVKDYLIHAIKVNPHSEVDDSSPEALRKYPQEFNVVITGIEYIIPEHIEQGPYIIKNRRKNTLLPIGIWDKSEYDRYPGQILEGYTYYRFEDQTAYLYSKYTPILTSDYDGANYLAHNNLPLKNYEYSGNSVVNADISSSKFFSIEELENYIIPFFKEQPILTRYYTFSVVNAFYQGLNLNNLLDYSRNVAYSDNFIVINKDVFKSLPGAVVYEFTPRYEHESLLPDDYEINEYIDSFITTTNVPEGEDYSQDGFSTKESSNNLDLLSNTHQFLYIPWDENTTDLIQVGTVKGTNTPIYNRKLKEDYYFLHNLELINNYLDYSSSIPTAQIIKDIPQGKNKFFIGKSSISTKTADIPNPERVLDDYTDSTAALMCGICISKPPRDETLLSDPLDEESTITELTERFNSEGVISFNLYDEIDFDMEVVNKEFGGDIYKALDSNHYRFCIAFAPINTKMFDKYADFTSKLPFPYEKYIINTYILAYGALLEKLAYSLIAPDNLDYYSNYFGEPFSSKYFYAKGSKIFLAETLDDLTYFNPYDNSPYNERLE